MRCPRCQNEDERYFYKLNGVTYCRKCIHLNSRKEIQYQDVSSNKISYKLDYPLTQNQQDASNKLVERYLHKQNTILKAVCGAGKTEMIYEVIKVALNNHQKVCLTIPRKELVGELSRRIEKDFISIKPTVIYGGHVPDTMNQFVVCTTHQLYRFVDWFDLLILDEMDAFPYACDTTLQNILKHSIKGQYIYMSATIEQGDINIVERFHHQPIIVPKCIHQIKIVCLFKMILQLKQYQKEKKPVFLFVESINQTLKMKQFLDLFIFKSKAVSSQSTNIHQLLDELKKGKLDIIITTTVLERGITLENVQVIVFNGHHHVFNKDVLIQIAGRVGRKYPYTSGDVTIYAKYVSKEIKQCIYQIEQDNALSASRN